MLFTNCCFLKLIFFYFSLHVINASTYLFNDTENTQKLPALGSRCERDEDCEHSTVRTTSTRFSCFLGLGKCKNLEKGQCTSLIEPCIEPLCSGFSVNRRLNQNLCVPGRCECPEELQFCTNKEGVERIKFKINRGGKIIDDDMIDRQNRKFIRVFFAFFDVVITDWYLLLLLFSFFVVHTLHERDDVWLVSFLTKFLFPAILYVICVVLYRELRVVETMLLFTAISIIVIEYYFVAPIYLNNQ